MTSLAAMSLPNPTLRRRAVLAGLAAAPLAAAFGGRARAAEDGLVAAAVAESGAPAIAAAVFDAEKTLFLEAAGVRAAGAEAAVTTGDLWHLGSNTKAMTALLYARLVDQGRIPAWASLADLLPGIALDPAYAGLGPEDLMAHAAGLGDETAMGRDWLFAARLDQRPLPEQRLALAAATLSAPPAFPERGFHYANINFVVLGAILEQATGRPWEDLMRDELFGPLGMASAGFGAPQGDQPWGHLFGVAVEPRMLGADNPAALGPAGTVHVALEDYAKFLRLFMTEGGGHVSPEAMARIATAPVEGDSAYRWGWMVYGQRPWATGPALAHEGSNTMWHAVALVAPLRRIAIVAVSNDHDKGGPAVQKLALELIRRFAPA